MPGALVLQGGGSLTANDELDRRISAEIDSVVVLPTADAYERPEEMITTASAWGDRIGIEIDPPMVLTRPQVTDRAAQVVVVVAVADADAVFLAGDSSIHLRSVIKNTHCLQRSTPCSPRAVW